MKLLRSKFRLYKRFALDIFGLVLFKGFCKNRLSRYVYSAFLARMGFRYVRRMQKLSTLKFFDFKWFRHRFSRKYLFLYFLKFFYYGLRQYQLRSLVFDASCRQGFWVDNFLMVLESRISTVLYRSFFFFNLIGLKKFIFSGFVLVDRSPIYNVNFRLGVGKLVQILPCLCCSFRHDIFLRLRSGFILHVVPDYLYVSFIFMFSLLVCYPRYFKLVYPIGLDVYRYIDLI